VLEKTHSAFQGERCDLAIRFFDGRERVQSRLGGETDQRQSEKARLFDAKRQIASGPTDCGGSNQSKKDKDSQMREHDTEPPSPRKCQGRTRLAVTLRAGPQLLPGKRSPSLSRKRETHRKAYVLKGLFRGVRKENPLYWGWPREKKDFSALERSMGEEAPGNQKKSHAEKHWATRLGGHVVNWDNGKVIINSSKQAALQAFKRESGTGSAGRMDENCEHEKIGPWVR